MKLRIKFSKYGALKFIGHLDVMRFFQKANRRANIDVAYSTGFSPHQIMSFAQPLGLGLESTGEYLDLEVNSITTASEMMTALNNVMVEGIEVTEIKLLPDDAGNAMASVAAASYTIRFREEYKPDADIYNKINEFYSQNEILVTKKTKKSEAEVDLKPFIYFLKGNPEIGCIDMLVDCSSANNVNPKLVMKALYNFTGFELDEYGLLITRNDTYMYVGEEDNKTLCPLGAIGEDF